ncbi:hypothetical protein [Grimontia marina]|uniref:hypothetical protein n=1 Tax=Grimontia marina TaxID=646534 RepID=UPI000AAEB1F1|nr:hypothetical protein [Grimontia marina]
MRRTTPLKNAAHFNIIGFVLFRAMTDSVTLALGQKRVRADSHPNLPLEGERD